MPKVRSGTNRRGCETGVYGNAWPMTPTPLGADAPDERGEVGVAAHSAVASGERREVQGRVRVRRGGVGRQVVGAQELRARDERRLAALVAEADQRIGLAVEHGTRGRVGVGHVQQRDVAEGLELEEALGPVVGLEPPRVDPRCGGDREELEEVAPRDVHLQSQRLGSRVRILATRVRGGAWGGRYPGGPWLT